MSNTCFGASLSIKQCRNFNVSPEKVLNSAIHELGLRRFRLMSYWDECEPERGVYKFAELDRQIDIIAKSNGAVSLCLGVRQPRWPESHWPKWSKELPAEQKYEALKKFIKTVVNRYKNNKTITEWQLENEALLKTFGQHGDFSRQRLRREYKLVKELDSHRPIIMTTSTSWGVPIIGPIPDRVGFSYYRVVHNKGRYRYSVYQPWIFELRALLIKLLWRRPSFIHELQAEPWGPKEIWQMPEVDQDTSMSVRLLKANIAAAKSTNLYPIDLWGLEWWYWRKINGDDSIWQVVKRAIT